jgi:hypothetical protein
MEWRDYIGMRRANNAPEVRFSLEARQASPAQTEAGDKFFSKLTARACAGETRELCGPTDGQERSDEQDVAGERRWPSS